MRQSTFGILPIFWLVFAVISIESRSVNRTVEDDATEEDFDLENALSDYYDSLMELWGLGQKTEEKQENKEEDKVKPKREEGAGNNLSGLLYKVPNATEYDAKSFYDLTVPIQIGNITYRFLNESHAAVLDRQRANRESAFRCCTWTQLTLDASPEYLNFIWLVDDFGDHGIQEKLNLCGSWNYDGSLRLSGDTDEGNTTRIKNLRIDSIKETVLNLRGGNSSHNNISLNPKQTKTLKDLFEKRMWGSSAKPILNEYSEKSLSFFPSCEIPKNTDEIAWSEPYSMNLFFDVYFPAPQPDSALMIVNAALKLFTISQASPPFTAGNVNARNFGSQMNHIPNYGLVNDDDKRIRVSVYWHTRSVRRQRIKKKLLDSRMLSVNGENSLTFDIRPAVRSWKESGKNFGLQVIVEDENGTLQRPIRYLHPMNCSRLAADVKPLPLFGFDSTAQSFLEDTAEDGNRSEQDSNFPYRPVKYPVLGLQMRDVSLSEVQSLLDVKSAQMDLASNYSRKDVPSRITDFENVPLGVPLNNPKVSGDNLKLIAK